MKSRNELQQEYIDWYLDGTSREDLEQVVATQMWDDLDMLDDDELIKEVKEYAPELLENA